MSHSYRWAAVVPRSILSVKPQDSHVQDQVRHCVWPSKGLFTYLYVHHAASHVYPKSTTSLGKTKNSFRRNRSTTSQMLTIRRIFEGVRAKNLQATLLFVDFTKAFDSIQREDGTNPTSIRPTKRDRSSNNDSLQKHQSESTLTGRRHRILRLCNRSTTRGHASPIPLYHPSRLRA